MEAVVSVRGECMNGWKDFKTDDKMSVMNTGVGDQLAWQVTVKQQVELFSRGHPQASGQVDQVCCEAEGICRKIRHR